MTQGQIGRYGLVLEPDVTVSIIIHNRDTEDTEKISIICGFFSRFENFRKAV